MVTYKWTELYQAALLETDWTKIEGRIKAVEDTLHERKAQFALDHDGSPDENQAIDDALRGLSVLRKEAKAWLANRDQPTGT